MRLMRIGFWGVLITLAVTAAGMAQENRAGYSRSGYSYIRETSGEVTVISRYNGRVAARRNLPLSGGDEIEVAEGARAEIALADGNLLHVGGGSRARFSALRDQQGEDDEFSAIELLDGSVILTAVGADEDAVPRIDTDDATVYLTSGARARVNFDSRRGTVVIARAGTMEVRTREGSQTLRSGEYLMVQEDQEPEIARGSFSRDRFDIWAADRIGELYETRSASARYVNDDYDSEVVALDGYGDWSYSDTYSTHVWTPRVSVGWTPYSYGSWYYTPLGMTWWSYDPWGWYPHHYGNWFFASNRWCWAPGYAYSPAWVYWAYSPGYVGWCPTGYYGFHSPWWNNYYRRWGFPHRAGIHIGIHGTFNTRNVDFRGWNFAGSGGFGVANARMDVIPGSRIADRLGDRVAVSSRPLVVETRGGASTRDAIRDHIREAPRVIERTSNPDSSRMAPVLAREQVLSADTQEALRGRAVVAEGARLSGPGVSDVAPRGAIVDRNRSGREVTMREARDGENSGRSAEQIKGSSGQPAREISRSRPTREVPSREESAARPERAEPAPPSEENWRGRGQSPASGDAAPEARAPRVERQERGIPPENPNSDSGRERPKAAAPRPEVRREAAEAPSSAPAERDWRMRGRSVQEPAEAREAPQSAPSERSWRSRPEAPAVRIIEGAVPGRRSAESREAPQPRSIDRPQRGWEPRSEGRAPQSAPPAEIRRSEPRNRDYARPQREGPSSRSVERAPAPPPPRAHSQPPPSAPKPAPPPPQSSGRGRDKN